MKKIRMTYTPLITILICIIFAACSNEGDNEPEIQIPAITSWYIGDYIEFTKDAQTRSISFSVNFDWSINVTISNGESKWCMVTPTNGSLGEQYIEIKVLKNDSYNNRSAIVTLECEDETKSFRIEQKGLPKPEIIIVKEAGTLEDELNSINKELESLIIEGSINGNDIGALRTLNNLKKLDLSNANIVKGGSFRYKKNMGINGYEWYSETCKEDNVIPSNMFNNGFRILEELILPNTITSIGNNAFEECISLKSIKIPYYVNAIGSGAFKNCFDLEHINLPVAITSIDSGVFWQCNSLSHIYIPEGVTKIESSAFAQCRNLASITLPITLVEIGPMAFSQCNWGLTQIILPENLKKIGYQAFHECNNLTFVTCLATKAPDISPLISNNSIIYPFDDNFKGYLSVPKGSSSSYNSSDWKQFFIIEELDE